MSHWAFVAYNNRSTIRNPEEGGLIDGDIFDKKYSTSHDSRGQNLQHINNKYTCLPT